MRIVPVTICTIGLSLLAACAEEPPPVSVTEFMENPRLLEATMVRCAQNRSEMKYEAECVNARDAVNRLERAAERQRRAELEEQSERKRQALRRTQEAAAAARRRAEEEQRQREEAEYLGLFEAAPADAASPGGTTVGSIPGAGAETPPATTTEAPVPAPAGETPAEPETDAAQAVPTDETASDLAAIREELRRRQEAKEN